jgi:hypothetical protein
LRISKPRFAATPDPNGRYARPGWRWPTMEARRWLSGKFYCFSRGELREPKVTPDFP